MMRTPILVVCVLALGCGARPSPVRPASPALADAQRALEGTWRCTGTVHGPDGASPSQVTLDARLDLGGAWLRTDFAVTAGKYPYGFRAYRTYDAAARTWRSVIVDNMGGHAVSSSADGHVWTGTSTGPAGAMQIKDTEAPAAANALALRGQYSLDGGTFHTGYDLTCTR